jgi:hypothetical protein
MNLHHYDDQPRHARELPSRPRGTQLAGHTHRVKSPAIWLLLLVGLLSATRAASQTPPEDGALCSPPNATKTGVVKYVGNPRLVVWTCTCTQEEVPGPWRWDCE